MSRVALITGGGAYSLDFPLYYFHWSWDNTNLSTASGIGFTAAHLFFRKGWKVAIVDINRAGEQLARDINGDFYRANVKDYQSIAQAFEQVWNKYERIDFG